MSGWVRWKDPLRAEGRGRGSGGWRQNVQSTDRGRAFPRPGEGRQSSGLSRRTHLSWSSKFPFRQRPQRRLFYLVCWTCWAGRYLKLWIFVRPRRRAPRHASPPRPHTPHNSGPKWPETETSLAPPNLAAMDRSLPRPSRQGGRRTYRSPTGTRKATVPYRAHRAC